MVSTARAVLDKLEEMLPEIFSPSSFLTHSNSFDTAHCNSNCCKIKVIMIKGIM